MATVAPDPCVKVNAIADSNLMLSVYLIKHRYRVSIDVTFVDVTLAEVMKLAGQREINKDSTEGSVATPTVHTKYWSKTLKGLEGYIRTFHGVNGTPLSYAVRK